MSYLRKPLPLGLWDQVTDGRIILTELQILRKIMSVFLASESLL